MPPATKTIRDIGQTDRNANAAVCGDDFEEDVEDGVGGGVGFELGGFGYGDEEDGEDDPPEVVGELAAELLADEVAAGFSGSDCCSAGVGAVVCHGAFQAVEEVLVVVAVVGGGGGGVGVVIGGVLFLGFGLGVVGVDAEAAFFIDVGVAHGYYDGVDGDVHHDDVED